MKYEVGQALQRVGTGQKFTIKKMAGFCKKRKSFGVERVYELKGPHPSLDLLVRKSELDALFKNVN